MYQIFIVDAVDYVRDIKYPHSISRFKSELHAANWLKIMLREDHLRDEDNYKIMYMGALAA